MQEVYKAHQELTKGKKYKLVTTLRLIESKHLGNLEKKNPLHQKIGP